MDGIRRAYDAAPGYLEDVDAGREVMYEAGNRVLQAAQESQGALQQVDEALGSAALAYLAAFTVGLGLLYSARALEGKRDGAGRARQVEERFDPTSSDEDVTEMLEPGDGTEGG